MLLYLNSFKVHVWCSCYFFSREFCLQAFVLWLLSCLTFDSLFNMIFLFVHACHGLFMILCFYRRRQQPSKQQGKHGIRQWYQTVTTLSLRISPSGWVWLSETCVFCLELDFDANFIYLVGLDVILV